MHDVLNIDRIVRDANTNHYSRVWLAGGAVRDMLLNKPVRDVDLFFVNAKKEQLQELKSRGFGYVGWLPARPESGLILTSLANDMPFFFDSVKFYVQSPEEYKEDESEFLSMLNDKEAPGINIIPVVDGDIYQLLERFPVGISKVAMNLTSGEIVFGEGFLEDLADKTTRFKLGVNDKYIDKINEKYKDWDWDFKV